MHHLRHLSRRILCLDLPQLIVRILAFLAFLFVFMQPDTGWEYVMNFLGDNADPAHRTDTCTLLIALLVLLLVMWVFNALWHHFATQCRLRQAYLLWWLSGPHDQPLDLSYEALSNLTGAQLAAA